MAKDWAAIAAKYGGTIAAEPQQPPPQNDWASIAAKYGGVAANDAEEAQPQAQQPAPSFSPSIQSGDPLGPLADSVRRKLASIQGPPRTAGSPDDRPLAPGETIEQYMRSRAQQDWDKSPDIEFLRQQGFPTGSPELAAAEYDVAKGITTSPADLGNAVIDTAENAYNLPGAVYNAPGIVWNKFNPDNQVAPLPQTDFPEIPIPNELQSTTGQLTRQYAPWLITRGLVGKAAPGGGAVAELNKNALSSFVSTPGDLPERAQTAGMFALMDAPGVVGAGAKSLMKPGARLPPIEGAAQVGGPPASAGPPAVVSRPGGATPQAPVPVGAAPATAVSSLGEAELEFNAMNQRAREAVMRAMEASGVPSRQTIMGPALSNDQIAIIRALNNVPPGRNNQYFFEIGRQFPQYPTLYKNLLNMGSEWAVKAPAQPKRFLGMGPKVDPDHTQTTMNFEQQKQVNSEGPFVARSAQTNFGDQASEVVSGLDAEQKALAANYRALLDPTRKTRLKNPEKLARLRRDEETLRGYLMRPEVVQNMPDYVKQKIMSEASKEMRDLKFTPTEIGFITQGNGAVLKPLFTRTEQLQWSPQLWDHLVRQYPKVAGHIIQSAYGKAIGELQASANVADKALIDPLKRARGFSDAESGGKGRGEGLLALLESTMPGKGGVVSGEGGYQATRLAWADVSGAKDKAVDTGRELIRAVNDDLNLAEVQGKIKALTPKQKETVFGLVSSHVRMSLGDKVANIDPASLGRHAPSPPNLTKIGKQNFLNMLRDTFGEEGNALAHDIEFARASTTTNQAINPNINSLTAQRIENVKNAPNVYENPAGLEGNVIDRGAQYTAGGAAALGILSHDPGTAALLALVPAVKVAWNAYKKSKRLTNAERNQLATFFYKSREAGLADADAEAMLNGPNLPRPPQLPQNGPRPKPNLPSPAGHAGNVITGAAIGGGVGYGTSNGDPGATAAGVIAGAGLGAGRALQRSAKARSSLIPPRRIGANGLVTPSPSGPGRAPPSKNGLVEFPPELGGAALGGMTGAAVPGTDDERRRNALIGVLSGAAFGHGVRRLSRFESQAAKVGAIENAPDRAGARPPGSGGKGPPLDLGPDARVFRPGQPDDLGFVTSAEHALANPPPRFRDAKALNAEQWRKLMREGGASQESFTWQIEPALRSLAERGLTGDITRAQMEEALARQRGTLTRDLSTKESRKGWSELTNEQKRRVSESGGQVPERDYSAYVAPGEKTNYQQEVIYLPQSQGQGYRSHNWINRNPVGHIRTTDRVTADDRKVLHVEELQSDLHQEGAQFGYGDGPPADRQKLADAAREAAVRYRQWSRDRPEGQWDPRTGGVNRDSAVLEQIKDPVGRELWKEAIAALERFEKPQQPPRAPMENWEEPFVRHVLQRAAREGYDTVTFPTHNTLHAAVQGEGTAKFYDQRLPNTLARVAKSLGLKVEPLAISVSDRGGIERGSGGAWQTGAQHYATVPAIRLTPQAKEQLKLGVMMDASGNVKPPAPKRPPPSQASLAGPPKKGETNGLKAGPPRPKAGLGERARRALVGAATGAAVGYAEQADAQNTQAELSAVQKKISELEADLNTFDKGTPTEVQEALRRKGFDLGKHGVDGRIGPDTSAAIGRYRQQTLSELDAARSRLKELETQAAYEATAPSDALKTLREAGPIGGALAGLVLGVLTRRGAVRSAAAKTATKTRQLNALITRGPVTPPRSAAAKTAFAKRAANINEFWRHGGAGENVPFQTTSKGEWRQRSKAASPSSLYSSKNPPLKGGDYGVITSALAESGLATVAQQAAQQEVIAAQAEVDKNPTKANLERLENAKTMVAIATTAQRLGLALAGARATAALKMPYRPLRPNVGAAESERALLLDAAKRARPKP